MTASLKIKNERYYAAISYKEGKKHKQKWIALGIPVRNNKRKAESMLEDIKKNFEERYATPSGDMLFTNYLKRWLEKKKPLIQLSTWEGYDIYVNRHVIPYFEPLGLTMREVKPVHIKEYYEYKYTGGRLDGKEGGLSIASIKKHAIVIKESMNDALIEDIVLRNPAQGVKLPAKDISTKEKVFLDANQANTLLKALDGHPLQAPVYVALYYGLRRSEILGLRWSAVDFENGTISINHTVVKNRTIVAKDTTKTETSYHTYPLLDDVRYALLAHKERQNENREAFGDAYKESDYIFTWPDGKLYRPDYLTRGFQRILARKGLKKMGFHDLRHSTASVLYDKGWGIKDIQNWLRHSSADTTTDIYTHITEDRKERMAGQLNSTFSIGEEKNKPQ